MVGGKFWFIFLLLIPGVAITGQDKTNDHQEADKGIENGTIDPSTLKSPSQTDIVDAKMDNGTTDAASLAANDTGTNGTNTTSTHQEAEKAMANVTIDSDTLPSLPNETSTQTSTNETEMGGIAESTAAETTKEATCEWIRVCGFENLQSLANQSQRNEEQLMMYAASKTSTTSTTTNEEDERNKNVHYKVKSAKAGFDIIGTAATASAALINNIQEFTEGSSKVADFQHWSVTKQHEASIREKEEIIGSYEYSAKEQDKTAAEHDANAAKEDKMAKESQDKAKRDEHKKNAKDQRDKAGNARSKSKNSLTKAAKGKTALATTKKIGPFAKKAHMTARFIKSFGKVLSMLGPVMSAVSTVMSVLSIFLPQPESPELQAIKEMRKEMEKGFQEVKEEMRKGFKAMEKTIQKGFKEMHGRFDIIEERLDRLEKHVELTAAINAYREKRVVIKALKIFKENPNNLSTASLVNFHEQCRLHHPLILLYWFHDYMIDKVPTGKPGNMLDSILTVANYSLAVLMEWQVLIVQDVNDLASIHGACLGMASAGNTKDPYVVAMIKEGDKIVQKIKEKMSNTTTYLEENFFELAARKEIMQMEKRNKAQVQNYSAVLHHAREIYVHLVTKYYFVEWAVITYEYYPQQIPSQYCTILYGHVLPDTIMCWCKPVTVNQRAMWVRSLEEPKCHNSYVSIEAPFQKVYNSAKWANTGSGENKTEEGSCSVVLGYPWRGFYMIRPIPPTDAGCFKNDTTGNETKAP